MTKSKGAQNDTLFCRCEADFSQSKQSHLNFRRLPRRPDESGLLAMTNGVSTLAGGFVLGAEASGADVDFSFLSFYHNRSSVNIR